MTDRPTCYWCAKPLTADPCRACDRRQPERAKESVVASAALPLRCFRVETGAVYRVAATSREHSIEVVRATELEAIGSAAEVDENLRDADVSEVDAEAQRGIMITTDDGRVPLADCLAAETEACVIACSEWP